MATPEEIRREKELIALKERRLQLDKEEVRESDSYSNALRDQLRGVKNIAAEKSEILAIDRRLNKQINDNYGFDLKRLSTQKGIADIQKSIAQQQRDQDVLKTKMGRLDADDVKRSNAINKSLRMRIKQSEDLVKTMEEQAKIGKEISETFSVRLFGGAAGIADALGLKQLAPELQAAQEASAEAALSNISSKKAAERLSKTKLGYTESGMLTGKGITKDIAARLGLEPGSFGSKAAGQANTKFNLAKGNKAGNTADIGKKLAKSAKTTNTFLAGLKALGPLLQKLLGPLTLVLDMISLDKGAGEMAKGMNLTYKEALALRTEMVEVGLQSGNIFVNSKGLMESTMAVNKALGTTVPLSREMATQFTEMREMAGFTNEELVGIAKLSAATDMSMDDITGQFMAQAKLSGLQNGVLLNEKDLLKDIGNVSAATTLSFGKNPKLIGEAVATAKSLGMELSKVEGIAEGLLNFEDSIRAELEAEVLLNRDINLEKARQAALNNDLATVAQEISKQAGTAAEFAEMNRIQQDSIAKAVGMSRNELAETLFTQEQLTGLSGQEAKDTERIIQARIREVGLAKTQQELQQGSVDKLRQQASISERFGAIMEKLQELFVNLVTPLMPLLDGLMSIAGVIGKVIAFLEPIAGTLMGAAVGFMMGGPVGALIGAGVGMVGDLSGGGNAINSAIPESKMNNSFDTPLYGAGSTTMDAGRDKTIAAPFSDGNREILGALTGINNTLAKQQVSPVGLYQTSKS
jgi:hypothetical protein